MVEMHSQPAPRKIDPNPKNDQFPMSGSMPLKAMMIQNQQL
jgi:hypothetical protein